MIISYISILGIFFNSFQMKTDTIINTFASSQLTYERVQVAYQEKDTVLQKVFIDSIGIYPPTQVFFRAFKNESTFEVWALHPVTNTFHFIKKYSICKKSGVIGPKREEGDRQVPEGFYTINVYNPESNFFLSLGLNYPNTSDSILTTNKEAPGGDIYIHGDCLSIGCLPLTDEYIKEVYLIAMYAHSAGQEAIPVHIFPFNYAKPIYDKLLANYSNPVLKAFWYNLKEGFDYFQKNKRLPHVIVLPDGTYQFN